MRRLKLFGSMLGIFLAMTLTSKADVQIGGFETPSSCIPFGNCGYLGEYQQVYAGAAFTGITNLVSISFAPTKACGNTVTATNCMPTFTPGLQTLYMQAGLSTTTATPSDISIDYEANKGADFTTVFSGMTTFTPQGLGTFDLVLPITSAFFYNPQAGNLLLDVVIDWTSGIGKSYFGATNNPATGSVSHDLIIGASSRVDQGLVTRFGEVAVPEPDAVLLLATVVGLLIIVGRRKMRPAGGTV